MFEVFQKPQWRRESAVHGSRSMYNKGCRCDACTAANRDAARKRREANR